MSNTQDDNSTLTVEEMAQYKWNDGSRTHQTQRVGGSAYFPHVTAALTSKPPKPIQISAVDAKTIYILYDNGEIGCKEFGKPVRFVDTTYPGHEA